MGLLFGVPLGVAAAVKRNKLPDTSVRAFSLVGYSIPDFYLGAMLLIVFALNLGCECFEILRHDTRGNDSIAEVRDHLIIRRARDDAGRRPWSGALRRSGG